jgi:hypothetical protein
MKYIALLLLTGCCSGKCVTVEIKAGGDVIMGEEPKKCPVAPKMMKEIRKKYDVKGRRLEV